MLLRRRTLAVLLVFLIATLLRFKHSGSHPTSQLRYLTRSSTASLESISNATLGFQSVFVINLPSRTDRRDAMTLAAALSGLEVTWIDGVAGADVPDEALPGGSTTMRAGNRGSWRAHMNVLQRIVQHNLTSALILEDDADWDVRLKSQLQTFARAARAFTQPSSSSSRHGPGSQSVPITELPAFPAPRLTPYGDAWDVLWLGHCGTSLPSPSSSSSSSSSPTDADNSDAPLAVTIPSDATVPPPRHLRAHPFAMPDHLAARYPPHTRVVHLVARAGEGGEGEGGSGTSTGTACTQAYAVSRRGARRLLHRFGLASAPLTKGWDLLLGDWCEGERRAHEGIDPSAPGDADGTKEAGREVPRPRCVTVQPPLFSHHYGTGGGGKSDISAPGGGYLRVAGPGGGKGMTPYVRWSVRLNMGRLVEGGYGVDTESAMVDQWPEEDSEGRGEVNAR